MRVAVVLPWSPGCPHREAARDWVVRQYGVAWPDWELVWGECAPGPFNRSAAILDGARQTDADVLIVADADVWTDWAGVPSHAQTTGWAIPHYRIHRLSPESTARVLTGEDPRGLQLSVDNPRDSRPYIGYETGTAVAIRRDVLFVAPPDVRFVGWGHEDQAWAATLRCLVGPPHRGKSDLYHLWHPPQERLSREVGTKENRELWTRYRKVKNDPAAMMRLINEN